MAVFVVFAWGLRHLAAGRAVYATGSDPEARPAGGHPARRVVFGVFVVMGALAGLAALLNAVRFADVDPNAGMGLELQVIAAVVVGGVAVSGGRGTLVGPLLGRGPAGDDRLGPGLSWRRGPLGKGDPGRHHPARGRGGCAQPEAKERCQAPASPPLEIASRRVHAVAAQELVVWRSCWRLEIAVFCVIGTNFCSRANAFEVVRLSVEIGLLALALTPVIITGGIDLSVGSLMGLSAVVFGMLWRDGGLPIGVAAAVDRSVLGMLRRRLERAS